jgi:thioredoxin-related protein
MKKFAVVLLITLESIMSFGQTSQGIKFDSLTFNQALAKSAIVKKPVFVFGYATWCHFCEEMRDSVLTDSTIGIYYNEHFVCIKTDLEKEGLELNKILRARNFPTLVYYNQNGEMLHRSAGKKSKSDFMQLGKDALDSTKQLRTISFKYRDGKLNPKETLEYFRLVEKAGMDNQPLVNNYLSGISDEQLFIQPSWRIMYELLKDIDQPCVKRILENRDQYAKKYTADSIDNKILTLYNNVLMSKVQLLDTNSYNSIINKLKTSEVPLAAKIIAYAEISSMKFKAQWLDYKIAATKFADEYCNDDYRRLNEIANNFYERIPDKELLLKAEKWSERAVLLMDNYKNNFTLGSLYFKNGKNDQAKKVLEHAIEIGNKANIDTKQATFLLRRLNN